MALLISTKHNGCVQALYRLLCEVVRVVNADWFTQLESNSWYFCHTDVSTIMASYGNNNIPVAVRTVKIVSSASCRDRGATLRLRGGGGMTEYWGATIHFSLLTLYNFKNIGGARAPPPAPLLHGPCAWCDRKEKGFIIMTAMSKQCCDTYVSNNVAVMRAAVSATYCRPKRLFWVIF